MINTTSWKKFKIGDLFNVVKGTRLTKANMKSGNIRYIGASALNNGETARIGNDEHLHLPNTISVCYNGSVGETFYQEEVYWASDDVNVLYPLFEMTKNIALFMCPIIRIVGQKYAFVDKWKQEVMKETYIMLPAKNNAPDYKYMDSYMHSCLKNAQTKLGEFKKIKNRKSIISVDGWKDFRIGDLFYKLDLQCKKEGFNKLIDCSEEQTQEFSLPLTNAKHFNNGIQFYGRPEDCDSEEMTIDIVRNGAIATGDVYAQPQRTGVLWDSYLIKCVYKIDSEYTLHYLACIIEKCVKQFFGWDDKCTWDKVKEKNIKLPVTSLGEPDFAYMDTYMKSIMEKAQETVELLQTVNA